MFLIFTVVFYFIIHLPLSLSAAIPANYLDSIKNWLDKMDIIYSESQVNYDWNKIMGEVRSQIRDDPKNFFEEGGWDFLQPSEGEGGPDGEGLEEGDSAFSLSEEEEVEVESESEFSEEEKEEDDEDESSYGGDDDLEEEGLSWDEMEELAEKEDLRKNEMVVKKGPMKPPMRSGKPPMKSGAPSRPPMKSGASSRPPQKDNRGPPKKVKK